MDYRQVASKGEHMVSVEFENVNKQYDDGFQAVKGLSLDIKDKEFLVLLGRLDAESQRLYGCLQALRTSQKATSGLTA